MAAEALKISGLCKNFDDFCLKDIELVVPEGAVVGLIGENGAGKTTTIKAAVDLLHRDKGEVEFFGKRMEEDPSGIRKEVGVVFDSLHFSQGLNADKIEKICEAIYDNWDKKTFAECMEKFSLPHKKAIKDFSTGMKMKLNLAIGLSHNARLLIMDEPTSGLDPVVRDDILDIFMDFMQEENHAILLSSHITSDLEKIADYIAFIHKGRLIFCMPKDPLLYQYGVIKCSKRDFENICAEDKLAWRIEDYQCSVLTGDRRRAAARYPEMIIDTPTIDEIMLLYVKGERE